MPIHFGLGRLEFRKLFPKAPDWNPFHDLRIPTLVFGDPVRKWGKIESKVILVKIPGFMQHELRIQQKHLFPTVPKWNPLHNGAEKSNLKSTLINPVTNFNKNADDP